jgi:hypothetical protein
MVANDLQSLAGHGLPWAGLRSVIRVHSAHEVVNGKGKGERSIGEPVAIINCSPRAVHAPAALQEILQTMSAKVLAEAWASLLGSCVSEEARKPCFLRSK